MKHVKKEFDSLSFKEIIMYTMSVVCMSAAIVAIFLSMYIEPRGEIHASVLTYFGISMGFVGSVLGISAHYSTETDKFKAEMRQTVAAMRPQAEASPEGAALEAAPAATPC